MNYSIRKLIIYKSLIFENTMTNRYQYILITNTFYINNYNKYNCFNAYKYKWFSELMFLSAISRYQAFFFFNTYGFTQIIGKPVRDYETNVYTVLFTSCDVFQLNFVSKFPFRVCVQHQNRSAILWHHCDIVIVESHVSKKYCELLKTLTKKLFSD